MTLTVKVDRAQVGNSTLVLKFRCAWKAQELPSSCEQRPRVRISIGTRTGLLATEPRPLLAPLFSERLQPALHTSGLPHR